MKRPLVQAILLLSVFAAFGCQTTLPRLSDGSVRSTISPSLQIPLSVERLAVLHPRTYNRDFLNAYSLLAGSTFELKMQRPSLRIVERLDLPTIHSEQRFQLNGDVSDDAAVRVGRLLGADSILLYLIDGPGMRDLVLAKLYGEAPPVTVTSKVIRVESAEVLYHNVVTVPVPTSDDDDHRQPLFRLALQQGIAQTITDLQHAFR